MEREALIVGINKYPRIGDLDMPEADAKAIADILETYGGFKVTRLPEDPGERVSLERLEAEITRLFCPSGKHPPKTALFFFAGHGLLKSLGTATQSYLATSESDDARGIFGLSLMLLRDLLQDSPVTQQIVWLDCCFSGGFIDPKKADPGYAKGYDRCFIAACRDYEVAHGVGEHGVLTTALLAGLNPERHPRVTTKTLVAFVTQELRKVALPQSPIHEYSGEEIILTNSGGDGSAKSGWLGLPPYKGLQYFDNNEQDSELFCGRQEMTRQLIDRVRKSNFLVVVGASGSGKSSVVRAGLLHELELGEQLSGSDQWWIVPPFTPGEHPMESLRQAIANSFAKEGEEAIAATDASRVVLVVDQFEEAFTLCQDKEKRRQFFDCLLENPVKEYSSAPLQIIIVMRSDFFDKLTEPESIRLADKINEDAVSNLFTVTSMRGSELEQAIREPAQKVGLQIEDSLVKQILEDLGVSEPDSVAREPGSLPLLEYTLDLLWQRRQDYDFENLLTLKGYEDLEGVKGALKKRADEIFKNLADEEKQAAERIFLELTHIGEGAEDTRRRVSKTKLKTKLASAQLPESVIDTVVQKLADEKLVVTSGDSAAESMVEVAHEALIRHWPRLRDWVDKNREALRTERMIQVAAEEWRNAGKPERDYLWGGAKLAAAESYSGSVPLSSLAQEFIQASREHQEEEIKRERELRRQAEISEIDALNSLSQAQFLLQDQLGALVTSVKAGIKLKGTEAPNNVKIRTVGGLQQVVYGVVRERNRLEGHSLGVYTVCFSPDGQTIASASLDKTVKLWQPDGTLLNTLTGHTAEVYGVSFSPDGQTIVSASYDGTMKLWRLDGTLLNTVSANNSPVSDVAFKPDNETIASTSWDKTVRLWQPDGTLLITLSECGGCGASVSFSPDGQTLAFTSLDWSIKLWNLSDTLVSTLARHNASVSGVAFSPDGQTIASFGRDKTVKLWTLDGTLLTTLIGHSDWIESVSFSPHDQTMASASRDATVKLWQRDGTLLITLAGHGGWVSDICFSPDAQILASASLDRSIKLWQFGDSLLTTLTKHKGPVSDVSFSPDSQILASASRDATVKLWQPDGTLLATFSEHSSEVMGVNFSPDGQLLASVSRESVKLWQQDGTLLNTLTDESGWVGGMSFSPDGQTLALTSFDKSIKLWKLDGILLTTLIGHSGLVYSVSFSPDGQTIASASEDTTLKLWQRDGILLTTLNEHNGLVMDVSFSPDGQTIASVSYDGTLKLWSFDGTLIATFNGHSDAVMGVSFSFDGQTLASASLDKTIKLWHKDGTLLTTLTGHSDGVYGVSFSPDGQTLASASFDKTVILWNLNLDDLLVRGCNRLRDYLKTNPNVSESDRHLCDGIGTGK